MKPFNLELAKAGYPVCTKTGRPARIICFDRKNEKYPLVVLITCPGGTEEPTPCTENGESMISNGDSNNLMMASIKKEGWINLYKKDNGECESGIAVYPSEEHAIKNHGNAFKYIGAVKIEWDNYAEIES